MKRTIAILLPVYKNDNVDFFSQSLNSILQQTYQNVIVLIGVDGSINNALKERLLSAEKDDRIQVIYFKKKPWFSLRIE